MTDVVGLFDRLAPEYDAHFTRPVDRAEDEAVRRLLGPLDGLNVLDVGCGTGHFLETLNGDGPATYIGVDPSAGMLAVAREKHALREGTAFMHGPIERIDEGGHGFDLAIALWSMPYWQDRAAGLRSIRRVLKPSGRFFCVAYTERYLSRPSLITPAAPMQTDTPGSLRRSLNLAGFRDVRVRPFRVLADRYLERTPISQAAAWMVREAEAEKGYADCLSLIGEGRA